MVALHSTQEDLVAPDDGCPACGERHADRLVWIDDERVRCARCGTIYRPGAGEEADDDH